MSTLLIPCPRCGKELKLRDRKLLGRRGKCPGCEHRFVLQEPDEVELELADETPVVGTAAQWVPDQPSAGVRNSDQSPMPSGSAADHSDGLGAFVAVAPAVADPAGTDRLRQLRRRNARRRRVGMIAGGVVALLAVGVLYLTYSVLSAPSERSETARPQVDVAYQAHKDELAANAEAARSASPTRGGPVDLRFMPMGVRVVFHLRPAELWDDSEDRVVFRYSLGPLAQWAEETIRNVCLFEPQQIDAATLGLIYGMPGDPPEVCAVVRLREEPRRSDLLLKFQGEPNRDHAYPVYVGSERTYLIAPNDPRTFAVAPSHLAAEMVDAVAAPLATDIGIEELLRATDGDRHLTVVFRPDEARRHQKALLPENALPFFNHLLDWFNPDEIEAVAWSLHLTDDRFHSDVLLRNHNVVTTPQLQREMRKRLDALPLDVLEAVEKMQPAEVGKRQIIGRFPAMTEAFRLGTVNGISDRYVHLATVLPEVAGPNLALGTLLTWDESTRTDFTKAPVRQPSADPGLPARIADRLKKSIEIDFRRTPLEEAFNYIGSETGVTFDVDGEALKLSGYTKNMPQSMDLGSVPATKALHEIIKQYGDMALVVDEENKVAVVLTKAVAEQRGLTPFPLGP